MIGVGYVSAMLIVNVTALCLYRLTGRFGPFHALALVSLANVIGGIVATLLSRALAAHTLLLHGLILRRVASCGLRRGSCAGPHFLRCGQQPYPSDRIGDGDCWTIRGIGSIDIGPS
jgi:hypothetical protein